MDYISDFIKPNILSEISRDIGQVLFAGVVVGPIVSETSSTIIVIVGIMFSIGFWLLSIGLSTKE